MSFVVKRFFSDFLSPPHFIGDEDDTTDIDGKETSDCLHLTLAFFGGRAFVSRCRGNKQLVNHFIMNVVFVCKRSGIRII